MKSDATRRDAAIDLPISREMKKTIGVVRVENKAGTARAPT